MATTQVTDIIVPSLFAQYMREATAENSALFQSGAVVDSAQLSGLMAGGGNAIRIPFWQDLSGSDAIQSDDPNTKATATKVTADEQVAPVLRRVGVFSASDLAAALAGDDPMRVVADRIAPWWARQFNAIVIKILQGVVGALEAEDAGSAEHDISVTSGTKGLVSADAVIDAKGLLGDAADKLTLMFVHSAVYQQLQKNNLIDFIPDARGEVTIPTYLGMRLVQSDTLPKITSSPYSTNFPAYTSYILGAGAIQFGEVNAKVPVEIQREALEANGAGVEYFVNRRDICLHPVGMQYSGTISSAGPDNTALGTAGNWSRAFERKNVPVVALVTNG